MKEKEKVEKVPENSEWRHCSSCDQYYVLGEDEWCPVMDGPRWWLGEVEDERSD